MNRFKILFIFLLFGCSTVKTSVKIKESSVTSISFQDSLIKLAPEKGKAITQIPIDSIKNAEKPNGSFDLNVPNDTVQDGNIEIITGIKHNKINTQAIFIPKPIDIKIPHKTTVISKEVDKEEIKEPGFWDKFKYWVIGIGAGIILFYLFRAFNVFAKLLKLIE